MASYLPIEDYAVIGDLHRNFLHGLPFNMKIVYG
jgi:hypothetical protein